VKIVEWSDEDRCSVGTSPGLIYGGCHGEDEKLVAQGRKRFSTRSGASVRAVWHETQT
jgi:hypothetical protein